MKKRGGGGTIVQKQKQQRTSHKKVCDLGRTCPYQEEFQHMLEFTHDCEPQPLRNAGTGRSLGGGGSGVSSSSAGIRLGGSSQRRDWGYDVGYNAANAGGYDENMIRCELCSTLLSVETLEAHMLTHESKDKGLKNEQDEAYEQSILDDIQRQSAIEAERQEKIQKERDEKERHDYLQALEVSKAANAKAEREKAAASLLDEPGADYEGGRITIRFTLPSGKRVSRAFRAENSVQDAFAYLRSLEELDGTGLALRNAVNTLSVNSAETLSFAALGILGNTSLLVVEPPAPPTPAKSTPRAVPSSAASKNSGRRLVVRTVDLMDSAASSSSSNSKNKDTAPAQGSSASSAITLVTPRLSRKRKEDGAPAAVIDLTLS